jgi:hypothetical protein
MRKKLAVRQDRDTGRDGFHIGHDVRGENDDAFAGKLGEKIPEADALFGIEAGRWLIDDQMR